MACSHNLSKHSSTSTTCTCIGSSPPFVTEFITAPSNYFFFVLDVSVLSRTNISICEGAIYCCIEVIVKKSVQYASKNCLGGTHLYSSWNLFEPLYVCTGMLCCRSKKFNQINLKKFEPDTFLLFFNRVKA